MPKRWPPPKVLLFTDAPIRRTVIAETGGSGPGGRISAPTRFVARWDAIAGVGAVELVVHVQNGRPRANELSIASSSGLAGISVGSVSIERLVEQAIDAASFSVISPEGRRAIRAATRQRVTDERLQEIATAFEKGGIDAVTDLGVGERQGWRLVKRARQARLLPEAGQ